MYLYLADIVFCPIRESKRVEIGKKDTIEVECVKSWTKYLHFLLLFFLSRMTN